MPLLTKGSSAAKTALVYVTLGALVLVWTAIWFVYLWNHHTPSEDNLAYYWCAGFLATGLTLLAIGFGLGRLGRAARHAELPPTEVTQAIANAEQNAAARAPVVAPNLAAPMVMPGQAGYPAGTTPVAPAASTPPVPR